MRVLKPGGRLGVNSADGDRPHQSATLVREVVNALGLGEAAAASGFGINYRVNAVKLATLLQDAGFTSVQVDPHTFVDTLSGSDDLVTWSSARVRSQPWTGGDGGVGEGPRSSARRSRNGAEPRRSCPWLAACDAAGRGEHGP